MISEPVSLAGDTMRLGHSIPGAKAGDTIYLGRLIPGVKAGDTKKDLRGEENKRGKKFVLNIRDEHLLS